MTLYVAGEDIQADASVVESFIDGKLYRAGSHAGVYVGDAAENLREGFRVTARPDGMIFEDDG
jgi:hypothetical protein